MREFITYVDEKGHDLVLDYISQSKQPEAAKPLTMLEALAGVDVLRRPYFSPLRGLSETLAELVIGDFRIFAYRLPDVAQQQRYLLVHIFRKQSNQTPPREIDTALKRISAYRDAHE